MRSLQLLALTLGLSSTAVAQEPTLVAHYRLDETAGTVLTDSAGQGGDAALQGSYQLGTLGAANGTGGAVTFDEAGLGMGVVPNGPTLGSLRNDLSVTAWINPVSYGSANLG